MSNSNESNSGLGEVEGPRSNTVESAQSHEPKNTLESLPSDIRRHLLSCLDLHELSTIVHASPVYHAQYREDRRFLLSSSFQRTLGSVTIDAFAVHDYEVPATDAGTYISAFLKTYEANTQHLHLPLDLKHSLDNIISLVQFYLGIVTPLLDQFVSSTLEDFERRCSFGTSQHLGDEVAAASSTSRSAQYWSLTSSEMMRVTRAIYRFQLLCQITNRDGFNDVTGSHSRDTAQALFRILEPWEVDEVVAFLEWAKGNYSKLGEEVQEDLHPDHPRFADQVEYPPDGSVNWNEWDADDYYEGWTLRGLEVLHTVLFKIQDHEHLVSVMQQNIDLPFVHIDTQPGIGILGETVQWARYSRNPTERDHLQKIRAELPFRGDGEPKSPPLAWTIIWNGTHSSLYGRCTSEDLRRCGYVLWDAATLESGGGLSLIKRLKGGIWDVRGEWEGFKGAWASD